MGWVTVGTQRWEVLVCTMKVREGLSRFQSLFLDVCIDSLSNTAVPKALVSTEQIGWVYLPAIKIPPRRMAGKVLSNELPGVFSGMTDSNCPQHRGVDSASLGGAFLTPREWMMGNDSIIVTLVSSCREGGGFSGPKS